MTILILSIEGIEVVGGGEIACVTPDNVVAGACWIDPDSVGEEIGMAVWKDDPGTDIVEGFQEREPLRFIYWDPLLREELGVALADREDTLYFETDAFVVIGLYVHIIEHKNLLPEGFQLSPPYPNPFNNYTQITFTLLSQDWVTISLLDITGRQVRMLSSDLRRAGLHHCNIKADNLTSGHYWIRIETTTGKGIAPLVLLK